MSLKQKTISNVKWSFVESMSLKAIGFVLGIILARLLTPADFGLLAVVNVFYLLVTLFIDGGLKEALIQKKDATDTDYSTVFWLNLFMGTALYAVLFVAAPYIQEFYKYDNLAFYIRLQSVTLIIESFGVVQIAKATKQLDLKKITKARIPSSLISFGVGIFLAYHGYGILSLIVQQLINAGLYVVFLSLTVRYRPIFVFDLQAAKPLYKFGLKILGMSLLSRFYVQGLNLIYAKFYSPQLLGLNSKSTSMQGIPIEIINTTLMRGVYPTFVALQNNVQKLRELFLLNVKLLTYLMLTINGIFFFKALQIIKLLLGDNWLESVVYLKIVAVGSLISPITVQSLNIFKVRNLLNRFLKIDFANKIFTLSFVFILVKYLSFSQLLIIVLSINILFSMIYFNLVSINLKFSFFKQIFSLFFKVILFGIGGFIIDVFLKNFMIDANIIFDLILFILCYLTLAALIIFIFDRKSLLLIKSKILKSKA